MHVSALRDAGREEARSGPRKRVERQETADRKGRAVKVERVVHARANEGASPEAKASRNGRRFAAERNARQDGERSFKPREERGGDKPFRKPRAEGERSFKPREERGGDKPFRKPGGAGRPGGRPDARGGRPGGGKPSDRPRGPRRER